MLKAIQSRERAVIIFVSSVLACGGLLAANDDSRHQRSTPELELQGISLPASWSDEPEKKADTHIDAEWKAPSGKTVFGAVCIHVPPLMGGKPLVKSVKDHYIERQPGGKMTREWTDSSSRNWFEVDARDAHSKGFIITHGHHAWFVYYRYGTGGDSPQDEINVADHAINHVEPTAK